MEHPDEVPDELKEAGHTVPLAVWNKIRADAERLAAGEVSPDGLGGK